MSAPELLRVARLCSVLALAGLILPGQAQPGALEQGRLIAGQGAGQAVAACASCHGGRGEGSAAFPRLGGTGQAYLQAQLDAFANGSRRNPLMQPIAQGLSPAQREVMALYYSKLPSPSRAIDAAQPTPADAGAWLATRGRWSDQLPACAQCHGPGGNGVGPNFPPLAGLPAAYITAQLQAWKDGARPPGPLGLMEAVARKLADADVSAVSSYYATLGASVAGSTPAGGKGKVTP